MRKAASSIGVFIGRHSGPILIAVVMLGVGAFTVVPVLFHRYDADPDGRGPQLEIVPLDPPTP